MSEFESNMERMFKLMFEKTVAAIVNHAKVKSVDKTKDTCVLDIDGDADLINVRLKAVIDSNQNKAIEYPKVGSSVLYILIENKTTEAYVLACSEVEEIVIKIGNQKVVLNTDAIVFNDGLNDGMIKINELTNDLNAAIDQVNEAIVKFNAHTHTVATKGTAAAQTGTASVTSNTAQTVSKLNKIDYENLNIKH